MIDNQAQSVYNKPCWIPSPSVAEHPQQRWSYILKIFIPPSESLQLKTEKQLFFSPELYISSCSWWNGCGVHTHSHRVPWNEGVRRCWMMDGVVIAWFIAALPRPPLPICPQHVSWYRSNIVLWWVHTGVTLNVSHKAGVSEENKKKYVVFVQFLGFKSKLGPQKVILLSLDLRQIVS